MKKCVRCGDEHPEDFFTRKGGKPVAACKNCTRKATKEHYEKNKGYYVDKATKQNSKAIEQRKDFVVNYLREHPCVDCGEADIVVLEFDHLRDKSFEIGRAVTNNICSFEKLKEEIQKCEVRCANCHKRKTARQFNTYRYALEVQLESTQVYEA